jgi:N-acetyltransferase 10
LLSKLTDVKSNYVYYLGTSFGLTKGLYSFWKKNRYKPLYIKLTPNDITGEHSCIMHEGKVNIIETIDDITINIKWLKPFQKDFKHRFISLLSFDLKSFLIKLALHLLESNITTSTTDNDTDHNNS